MGRRPYSHVFYGVQIDTEFLDRLDVYAPNAQEDDDESLDESPYDIQWKINRILKKAENIRDYVGFDMIPFYDSASSSECGWYIYARQSKGDWENVSPLDVNVCPNEANPAIWEALELLQMKPISEIGWFHSASY